MREPRENDVDVVLRLHARRVRLGVTQENRVSVADLEHIIGGMIGGTNRDGPVRDLVEPHLFDELLYAERLFEVRLVAELSTNWR